MPPSGSWNDKISDIVFAGTRLPEEFTIGLAEPQTEVSVWLHGMGAPRDVTLRQTTACTAPLTICIAFHAGELPGELAGRGAVLKFCERAGSRVLGEIRLRFAEAVAIGGSEFAFFEVRGSSNYCLPRLRLWAHYAVQARAQWRRNDPADIRMTLVEQRAAMVTFTRPHFLRLVSVGDRRDGNIFPMNLMSDLGNGYWGLALREQRRASHLVKCAGRIAVSGIPTSRCPVAFRLVENHKKDSIDWAGLPFETSESAEFGIPVPRFATRVREMQIEKDFRLGSHVFFIARVISEDVRAEEEQACVVHGFYQFCRVRGERERLKMALAEDALHKGGRS
ncbi:MAG: hypothetical protein WA715_16550 [Candidatus Acidiferrum sp.]|jgi:hypothetical protein